ncbi:hypothetical protein [Novosphingobium sp.]|uniref:hypothetical protein n=1 Tax=Novosphingobium sp. TaxID=1874826 RepID=UPI00273387E6|nr:hypothetical protein [Novosphingobium sp.]MDP3907569.1 hypothetical protein [Novosphingobium sp.]
MIGAAAVVYLINSSTPNPLPFILLAYLIVFFGNRIMGRLTRVPTTSGFEHGSPDEYLIIETDYVSELAFKVWFVDGDWEAGRSFEISGKVLRMPETPLEGLQIGERATVQIYPLSGWFEGSRIGWIRARGTCSVGLPIPLLMQLLEDVRRSEKQVISIGFKATTSERGKPSFPIYLLEMEPPLH